MFNNISEDEISDKIGYYFERLYPYILSIVFTILTDWLNTKYKLDIYNNEGFEKMVETSITIATIIVGFLGAILPVVLSMKNEVEIVNYLFEEVDKEGLFKKYISSTITLGIFQLIISNIIFIRSSFKDYSIYRLINPLWIFFYISFILSTLRSMKHMVNVVFMNKSEYNMGKDIVESDLSENDRKQIEDEYDVNK